MINLYRRLFLLAVTCSLTLGLSAGIVKADLTFDASADFSSSSTSTNGVWSYGYRSTYNGAGLTLFDTPVSNAFGYGLTRTNNSLGAPAFFRITNGPVNGVPDEAIALHGGNQGDDSYAVLRFTSPIAALFDVNAFFLKGDTGVTDNFVLFNGFPLSADIDNLDSNGTYSNSLWLGIGDTVELVVGIHGDYGSDSTPVGLTLTTTAVPEPTSMCLACSGILAIAIRRRALKWRSKGVA